MEWKEAYFRQNYNPSVKGYVCPRCSNVFTGTRGFTQLHGDHVLPRSRGGLTIWDNLTLLCGPCNWSKNNSVT
jgi:5-methylcytosine-specific restriction endonuclease McrA